MRVLVTGGAGFIGSNTAIALARRHPDWELVAGDNLYRRGSEHNLKRLRDSGVRFEHIDIRSPDDLEKAGEIQALVECSAEPSVLASAANTRYAVHTNLLGAFHCLEHAARHRAHFVFLSTSRVYPMEALRSLSYEETESRFQLSDDQSTPGASAKGISEAFPMEGARSLYGSTKLGAELLIGEYRDSFQLPATINRCGVVAGPWQLGKVDQGVFTHWLLAFYWKRELSYIGYGGSGKQVRDLLHVDDLIDLIDEQLAAPEEWDGATVNVGGGRDGSLSLLEASALCRELTGNDVKVGQISEERPGDVPVYLSDCDALFSRTEWRPSRKPAQVLTDTLDWISENEQLVGQLP